MLASAEVTWPPLAVYTTPCVFGHSVIASSRQRIVVASAYDDNLRVKQLHVHVAVAVVVDVVVTVATAPDVVRGCAR